MVRGVGNILGLQLIRAFGDPAAVMAARAETLARAGVGRAVVHELQRFDRWPEVAAQLDRLQTIGGRLMTWQDADYPERLRQIYDPPLFLFICGELTGADGLSVAVVGSRAASGYGLEMARMLTEGLARYGLTVVSGLARGIDAAAHTGALGAGGRTIAVLGNGIDVVYPSEHHRLHMRIAQNGAVISELPLGTQPEPEHFPSRNRIISGLSLGAVVVEATARSGSLITAEYAVEQGREVFAVPGPVGARRRGAHHLIRQGAALIESAEDIIREIAPQLRADPPHRPAPAVDAVQAKILACLDETALPIDDVVRRSGLPAAAVVPALLTLELCGHVRQLPRKCFVRAAGPAPDSNNES